MENRINQIVTLENGNKYMILHQAIYNNSNYFVCSSVNQDETDLNDDFYLFEETKEGNDTYIQVVQDANMAKFIFEHLNLMEG